MLEVCFGDAEKGCIKVAQQELNLLGDESNGVVSFCALDVFDIKEGIDSEIRMKQMFETFSYEDEDEEEFYSFLKRDINDFNQLLERAKDGEHIRIWYSDVPSSMCGFHFVMSNLEDIECKVTAIKLPKFIVNKNGELEESLAWGAIHPEMFGDFISLEREISRAEIKYMADIWHVLEQENARLRVLINGSLVSAPVDFYDYYIRAEVPDGDFVMGRIIGEVLGKYNFGIGDSWVWKRIEKMIREGKIELVQSNERRYSSIFRKTDAF
jgi:hypothetical protein